MNNVGTVRHSFRRQSIPIKFPDPKDLEGHLPGGREKLAMQHQRRRNEQEIEIEKKLQDAGLGRLQEHAALSKVMDQLAKLADVNLHLDPQGLAQEGVSSDTPVTIELRQEVMLKSALNLILEPLHLSYVVKDEVLKITSEQMRAGQVYTVTYNVADLVMPIPNFVPAVRTWDWQGAYHDAMGNVGRRRRRVGGGDEHARWPWWPNQDGKSAQRHDQPGRAGPDGQRQPAAQRRRVRPAAGRPAGPGGLGGGAQADFDSLIDLITSTVQPTTWDDVGGPGSIAQFETNLSLVVSQTQEVHEEIVDLLEQLRRMQDLQVTIEVRFITLNDNFFERIGVDFDFNISKNIAESARPPASPRRNDHRQRHCYTPQLHARQRQRHVGRRLAERRQPTPAQQRHLHLRPGHPLHARQLRPGGAAVRRLRRHGRRHRWASPSSATSRPTSSSTPPRATSARNVLQAPKVTLFNGQQAFVSDTSQTPFVISVIPVVGDFAAAQQPVIVVLSEGTFMTVQAVVSNDRRFVRLTIVPFFSKIGDVTHVHLHRDRPRPRNDTTQQRHVRSQPANLFNNNANNTTTTHSGTTVQLPTFSFVTVTTTVSVPDGGTVLLGGIKRLSEGRNEYGVPILDKIPYLNRLVQERGHRPRDLQPDDDGHAANHHPGRGRREAGRGRRRNRLQLFAPPFPGVFPPGIVAGLSPEPATIVFGPDCPDIRRRRQRRRFGGRLAKRAGASRRAE